MPQFGQGGSVASSLCLCSGEGYSKAQRADPDEWYQIGSFPVCNKERKGLNLRPGNLCPRSNQPNAFGMTVAKIHAFEAQPGRAP